MRFLSLRYVVGPPPAAPAASALERRLDALERRHDALAAELARGTASLQAQLGRLSAVVSSAEGRVRVIQGKMARVDAACGGDAKELGNILGAIHQLSLIHI